MDFILLGVRCLCSFINIFEFWSKTQFIYVEIARFFQVSLLDLWGGTWAACGLELIISHYWGKKLLIIQCPVNHEVSGLDDRSRPSSQTRVNVMYCFFWFSQNVLYLALGNFSYIHVLIITLWKIHWGPFTDLRVSLWEALLSVTFSTNSSFLVSPDCQLCLLNWGSPHGYVWVPIPELKLITLSRE